MVLDAKDSIVVRRANMQRARSLQVESRRVRTMLAQVPPEIQAFIILAGPLSQSVVNPASVLLSRANRASQTVYGYAIFFSGWHINRAICHERRFFGNVVDGVAKRRELTLKAMGRISPHFLTI